MVNLGIKSRGNECECSLQSVSPEVTEELGELLGARLIPGDVVALVGELGTGKTCFTRGIARGLRIDRTVPIVSPSFTLINEYPGPIPLYHFDLYRIERDSQIFDLGYQEYFFGEGVTVIEWGEKAEAFLPEEHIRVSFTFSGDTNRKIIIKGPKVRLGSLKNVIEGICSLLGEDC